MNESQLIRLILAIGTATSSIIRAVARLLSAAKNKVTRDRKNGNH